MEIICIGDSLTYGYGVRRTQRWTELATERSGWKLINHGVCGDTTGGMLVRMREILRDLHSGKDERCFLLMGGYNDIFFSGSRFGAQENMGAMVHQLFGAGEMPIVAIGPGISGSQTDNAWADVVDFPMVSKCIRDYCDWLDRFCNTFGVRTIDFRDDFEDAEKGLRVDLYFDGVHPNILGHQIMADRVCKIISIMEQEKMNT